MRQDVFDQVRGRRFTVGTDDADQGQRSRGVIVKRSCQLTDDATGARHGDRDGISARKSVLGDERPCPLRKGCVKVVVPVAAGPGDRDEQTAGTGGARIRGQVTDVATGAVDRGIGYIADQGGQIHPNLFSRGGVCRVCRIGTG